jgi:hypothetical protein
MDQVRTDKTTEALLQYVMGNAIAVIAKEII